MLAVVDTNHFSELDRNSEFAARFEERRRASELEAFTTIVTIQEITRGWLALLNRPVRASQQVQLYTRFQRSIEVLREWDILPFDNEAAGLFENLQRQRLRVGTMDLKIAAISLARDATLVSRNLQDFRRVPNLLVEDWIRA